MTVSTPYGVTVPCFSQTQQTDLKKSVLQQIRNIAPTTSTMIVRLQLSITQIAHDLGPGGDSSKYTYGVIDPIVQKCNSLGLVCLLAFQAPGPTHTTKVSNWTRGSCPRYPGYTYVLPQDWAVFAGNVARHYMKNAAGLHIEIIECGNEDYDQNPYKKYHVCVLPEEAANTGTAVYHAVKAVNPNILVGGPASVSIDNRCKGGPDPANACHWWEKYFQARYGVLPPKTDYVNYHYYCNEDDGGVDCCFPRKGQPPSYSVLGLAQYIRHMNHHYSGRDILPIWLTECGFARSQPQQQKIKRTCGPTSAGKEITPAIQASLLTELMETGRNSGGSISAILWFTLEYHNGLSLAKSPIAVWPAYHAYQKEVARYPQWDSSF